MSNKKKTSESESVVEVKAGSGWQVSAGPRLVGGSGEEVQEENSSETGSAPQKMFEMGRVLSNIFK